MGNICLPIRTHLAEPEFAVMRPINGLLDWLDRLEMGCSTFVLVLNIAVMATITGLGFYAGGSVLKNVIQHRALNSGYLRTPGVLVILMSCVSATATICGIMYVTQKAGTCSKYFFKICLLLILAGIVTATTLYCVRRPQLVKFIHSRIARDIAHYNTSREDIDFVQQQFRCCGSLNSSDYSGVIPLSCYLHRERSVSALFKKGCLQKLEELMGKYRTYFIVASVIISVLMILGLFTGITRDSGYDQV